jgi:hypothetical protein
MSQEESQRITLSANGARLHCPTCDRSRFPFLGCMFRPPFCWTARSPTLLAFPRQRISRILRPRYLSYAMTASDWITVIREGCPTFLQFQKPIQKSQQDDRDYRLIRLENGLHAMLVHDAKADKAAASLDVAVGHLSDPVSHRDVMQASDLGRSLVNECHTMPQVDL